MGRRSAAQRLAPDSGNALSRRKIFKGAVGVAAAGVAGGTVLAEAAASPALAAPAARAGRAARGSTLAVTATTVEPGAVAPAVVGLTDAATIAVNASLGNDFRVTLGGDRIMGNPSNPADGQKITFQVTQGGAGSQAVTWGGSYEFSTGLPEPTLSSKAGDTDLLGFIYNADKDRWLLAGYVRGFASTAPSGPPPGTFRLFPATAGPSSAVSYSGPFIAGVAFSVTSGGTWFDGYWWWVCPSGQSTSPQKFALWQVYTNATGNLIASGNVTSGVLTPGQWNFVALPAPIPLAINATYIATTGFNDGFPDTNDSFGAGDPYSAGIVNGPLTAYSDTTGTKPAPFSVNQGVFSVASNDPTAAMPAYGYSSANFWMDLQVDTNPAGRHLLPAAAELPDTARHAQLRHHRVHARHGVPALEVLHAEQSLVLLRAWRERAAGPVRRLEHQHAGGGGGHRQYVAHLVGGGGQRLGVVLLQRRHAARR